MFKVYKYDGWFLTTDQDVEDTRYELVFEITDDDAKLIEAGSNIRIENDLLIIE